MEAGKDRHGLASHPARPTNTKRPSCRTYLGLQRAIARLDETLTLHVRGAGISELRER